MTKTTLKFSPIGRRIFSLATGFNFRIRDNDGNFYSIKPSTRPRGVKGEYGFETYYPFQDDFKIGVDIPTGEYALEPLKHGWLKLVPATGDRPLMLTSVQEAMQAVIDTVDEAGSTPTEEVIETAEEVQEEVAQEETPRERRNRLRRERRRAAKEQEQAAEAA